MVGPVEDVVGPRALPEVLEGLPDRAGLGAHDHEHARGHAAHVVHGAVGREDAALFFEAEDLPEAFRRGLLWAVHSGDVGGEAGRVGDGGHLDHRLGAVHEGGEHLGVHVLVRGLFGERLGGGVDV
jgi:hypothetical protein